MLFDSHCHLIAAEFEPDRAQVWQRAQAVGVQAILIPAVRATEFEPLLRLCEQPGLYPALGLHPLYWREHRDQDLEQLDEWVQRLRPVAIGETGLDFWPGTEGLERQLALFDAQLKLAMRHRLPVVIHARRSLEAVLLALKRARFDGTGVIHAFNGSAQQAQQLLDRGFYFGFGGGITYPRAQQTRARAVELPLERILLETDAPDMPLSGRQGARNSPELLPEVARALAQLKAVPVAELIDQTGQNACRLFLNRSHL